VVAFMSTTDSGEASTRSQKEIADWSAKLTRWLTLKDGTKLVTPNDARACLIRYFGTATHSRGVGRGARRAVDLVMKAAETGALGDRKAATDQVEVVLRWRAVY
jgi:hypothetical protein